MVKMVRSRRRSFFIANERIKRITDIQTSQSSQSTIDTETHRNTKQNRRQTQSRNTRNHNTNTASQSTNSQAPNSQLTNGNETQRRTRGKITQRRDTVPASQPTISEEPELNNNEQNQRVTRAKIAQRRNTVAESQSTIAEVPSNPKQRGRPARRQKRLNGIEERESNVDESIASTPVKITRRRNTNIASQSTLSDPPSSPKKRGRPARREKPLTGIEDRESSNHEENRRRTRSKSTHHRDTIPESAIVDQPEVNNNEENQRQTRSKSAQRREANAARQAEPSISPNQMVYDEPEVNTSGKNKRQKSRPNKVIPSKIQMRRNTIAVNNRELNDLINFEPPSQIPLMRDFTIQLDRLNSETYNQYRRAPTAPKPKESIACNSRAAKKIINRRCTVNIDRIDHGEIQSQPSPSIADSLLASSSSHSQSSSLHGPGKSIGPSVDSGLPIDRVESSDVEPRERTGDTTFYESDEMSSVISLQNHSMSQSLFTHTQVSSALGGNEYNNAMDVDGLSDISSHHAGCGTCASASTCFDEDADDEDDPNDKASTYCPSLPPLTPINIQQLLLSQTSQYHNWDLNRSSSNNSIAVQCDGGGGGAPTTTQFNSSGDQSASNKCFIDSPHISYGEFVTYGNETFPINCLDHDNQNIRHHFLNKYTSENIRALNTSFHGNLWVTEITGMKEKNSSFSFLI